MKMLVKYFMVLFISVTLGSCASKYELSRSAQLQLNGMNTDKAEKIVREYVKSSSSHGGICLFGNSDKTRVVTEPPVTIAGVYLTFTGIYGGVGSFFVPDNASKIGKGLYRIKTSINLTNVTEVRVLKTIRTFLQACPGSGEGWMLVVKPEKSLPGGNELLFNVTRQNQFDELTAALAYLSPSAKFVAGVGM